MSEENSTPSSLLLPPLPGGTGLREDEVEKGVETDGETPEIIGEAGVAGVRWV